MRKHRTRNLEVIWQNKLEIPGSPFGRPGMTVMEADIRGVNATRLAPT
jgi:hypothetical protein